MKLKDDGYRADNGPRDQRQNTEVDRERERGGGGAGRHEYSNGIRLHEVLFFFNQIDKRHVGSHFN